MIDGYQVMVEGRFLKKASIHDEEWQERSLEDPAALLAQLGTRPLQPDLFTFSERLGDDAADFPYRSSSENLAVIAIRTFPDWWATLPQATRKNVRRSVKRDVVVRSVSFDDALARGIKAIYDETPIRQGRRFWHYGKDLSTIKAENATYLDRSEFIAAYFKDELIGFIRMTYTGKVSTLLQIVAKNVHYDKRPANALLSKAVEVCAHRGMSYLVYGQYIYGNKTDAPLVEFKRRNGFEQRLVRRYYVPLTAKGAAYLALNLHLGLRRFLPKAVENILLSARARVYAWRYHSAAERAKTNTEELPLPGASPEKQVAVSGPS
jgi:hypothetical protein